MDVLEAIFSRRSNRKYTGEQISEADLKQVVKAGCSAPSAHNKQPWHFIVIRDHLMLEEISKMHPYAKMLPQAGCGIVVCGDKEIEEMVDFVVQDCSAAIENMLLAAHGLGLGAVWCGLYPVPSLTENMVNFLNIPSNIVPVGLVVVGNKIEDKKETNRYDEAKVHYEKW